jgi:hypothetical protein
MDVDTLFGVASRYEIGATLDDEPGGREEI